MKDIALSRALAESECELASKLHSGANNKKPSIQNRGRNLKVLGSLLVNVCILLASTSLKAENPKFFPGAEANCAQLTQKLFSHTAAKLSAEEADRQARIMKGLDQAMELDYEISKDLKKLLEACPKNDSACMESAIDSYLHPKGLGARLERMGYKSKEWSCLGSKRLSAKERGVAVGNLFMNMATTAAVLEGFQNFYYEEKDPSATRNLALYTIYGSYMAWTSVVQCQTVIGRRVEKSYATQMDALRAYAVMDITLNLVYGYILMPIEDLIRGHDPLTAENFRRYTYEVVLASFMDVMLDGSGILYFDDFFVKTLKEWREARVARTLKSPRFASSKMVSNLGSLKITPAMIADVPGLTWDLLLRIIYRATRTGLYMSLRTGIMGWHEVPMNPTSESLLKEDEFLFKLRASMAHLFDSAETAN